MGIFDRFKSSGQMLDGGNSIVRDEESALRLLAEGSLFEEEGQLEDALERYDAALALAPTLARAHFCRGNVLLEKGDADAAQAAYATALVYKPDSAAAYYNMGNALARLGRHEAALAAHREAIRLKPDFTDAEVAQGGVQEELGQLDAAVASYRRALELQPDYGEVHLNLGALLIRLRRFDAAAVSYRRALEIEPGDMDTHNNLGVALKELGQLDDAVASYRRALEIAPGVAEVHSNLGAALNDLGRTDEALASYQRALEIKPDFAEANYNLGITLQKLGQLHEASVSYRMALNIRPNYAEAHNNLGTVLRQLGQFDGAAENCRQALEIDPGYADAHMNLGVVLRDLGRFDEALASTRRALEIKPDFAAAHSNLLFIQNYLGGHPASLMLSEARRYGEMVVRLANPFTAWPNLPVLDRSLRVGLVSGDLRAHPVGYFVEGILAALASSAVKRLELYAYSCVFSSDDVAERIKAHCDGWRSAVGVSDEILAQRIRDDGIDILIDLSGHTAHNRLPLFARKPAPIQVSWLGYFATTGVGAIDYLIADPWTLPESEVGSFSETIWRLPKTRLCFTPPTVDLEVASLPALNEGCLTFACFNNLTKMSDAVVALWARILLDVPGARLFLMAPQLKDASVRQSVVERFSAHGIDAERLILEKSVIRAEYLATYQRVDIALDPFPYTGGTTTAEALWMGVPVLTLGGENFLSRQGVGLLMNAGLPDWIATDPDDYVARAVLHASNLPQLAVLRSRLRKQVLASPIFDAACFAEEFETALRGMWQRWCERSAGRADTN